MIMDGGMMANHDIAPKRHILSDGRPRFDRHTVRDETVFAAGERLSWPRARADKTGEPISHSLRFEEQTLAHAVQLMVANSDMHFMTIGRETTCDLIEWH